MAKEIPYFKFYIGDWSNGDITLESFELQGIFINVCAYYWSKDCDVTVENVKKKFRMVSDCIDELIACSCIKVIGDNISISFLNEQYESREVQKAINRNNGSLGGRPPKEKTEEKPNGLFFDNQNITNKKKRRVKKSKEEEIVYREFKHLSISLLEFDKLIAAGYSKDSIDDILDRIENYKSNKDYTSLYLTSLTWLRKNNKNQNTGSQQALEYERAKPLDDNEWIPSNQQ